MQETIEKLYDGELYPAEQMKPIQHGYKKKWQIAQTSANSFESKLPEELIEEFHTVMLNRLEVSEMEQRQGFVEGFRLGAKLLVEILIGGAQDGKS